MIIGTPGAAIGGLFYLLSAFAMPVREAVRAVTGRPAPRRWGLAWRQAGIAAAILASMWVVGWLLMRALTPATPHGVATEIATPAPRHLHNAWRLAALVLSMGNLLGVLASVQLLRLAGKRRARAPEPTVGTTGQEAARAIAAVVQLSRPSALRSRGPITDLESAPAQLQVAVHAALPARCTAAD